MSRGSAVDLERWCGFGAILTSVSVVRRAAPFEEGSRETGAYAEVRYSDECGGGLPTVRRTLVRPITQALISCPTFATLTCDSKVDSTWEACIS